MTERTITLRADLVERLESLAQAQGRSIDDVFGELLQQYPSPAAGNWALAVAEGREAADIDWRDEPDASEHSREHFERHLREKWQRTQRSDANDA
jgi:predicted transcriptional regulator